MAAPGPPASAKEASQVRVGEADGTEHRARGRPHCGRWREDSATIGPARQALQSVSRGVRLLPGVRAVEERSDKIIRYLSNYFPN